MPLRRRAPRLSTRLAALVVLPVVAVSALGAVQLSQKRHLQDAAARVEAEVARAGDVLEVYAGLIDESSASLIIVETARYHLALGEIDRLLGVDSWADLRAARARLNAHVDAVGQVMPAAWIARWRALQVAIDAGRADDTTANAVFSEGVSDAIRAVQDRLSALSGAGGPSVSIGVYRLVQGAQRTAEALSQASDETSSASYLTVPGLSYTSPPQLDLAGQMAMFAQATNGIDTLLGPRARTVWGSIQRDPNVVAFNTHLGDLLRAPSATPAVLDVPALARWFRLGIERQDRHVDLVRAATTDIQHAAATLRASADSAFSRDLVLLVLLAAGTALLTLLVARSIVRPLARLVRRATRLSQGSLDDTGDDVGGPREVGVINDVISDLSTNLAVLQAQAGALADADLDDPVLGVEVPGVLAASLRSSVERLATSMRSAAQLQEQLAASEARFRGLVQHSDDLISIVDRHGTVIYQSPSVERVLGYQADEVVGQSVATVLRTGEAPLRPVLDAVTDHPVAFSVEVRDRFGLSRTLEGTATPMFDLPEIGGLVLNARDVTARVRAEQTLKDSEARFRLMFESNPVPMMVYDPDTLAFVDVNNAAVAAYGWSEDEFTDLRVPDISLGADHADLSPAHGHQWVARAGGITRHQTRSGQILDVHITTHAFDHGGRHAVLLMAQDVSEQVAAERALVHQATHDALTGLPNRSLLLDRLEQALARAQAGRTAGVGLVFVDLDHFKVVNDAKGHGAGDRLLIQVAGRICDSVRPGDTVARFGGDEFVVVLEGVGTAAEATAVCERIREALAEPFVIDGWSLVVSASQGVALAGAGDSPEDLMRTADAAMYWAKHEGRDRSQVADDAIRSRAQQRLQIEEDMRRGLIAGEFIVHYQPIVSVPSGSVVGAEALVRWDHPRVGIIPPSEFIPVAEETGLIVPLGELVLRRALVDVATWPPVGPGARPYVSVNLSGRQLALEDLAERVAELLAAAGVAPELLHLEITETVLMADVEHSVEHLASLKALGVFISIDDFGTGYSSLSYLQRLPIDTLKVDRSFVELLDTEGRDASIISAVVNLGAALDIDVLAEGVESQTQLDALRSLGCHRAQGFHFSRPLPFDAFAELLRQSADLPSTPTQTDRHPKAAVRTPEPDRS